MKFRVLGICAGNGVMLHPFKKWLINHNESRGDYKTPQDIQWRLNFGDIPLNAHLDNDSNANVIIGHPTCGHSSVLAYSRGKKLGDGKKDATIIYFVDQVNLIQPKFFLFENLTTLFKSFSESEFDNCFKQYRLIKYNVSVSAFGNSQVSRERLIVVGIRRDLKWVKSSWFKLPKPENIKLKTTKELESNLIYPTVQLAHVRESPSTIVCMEKDFKKLTLAQVKKIWNSPEYKDKKKWDATTTGKGNMKNLPGVYRNLPDSYPLTARKQNRQFNSEGDIMSPRELARIQGIPDSFQLWYDPLQHKYCINKARVTATKTPPYELGVWFFKCLKRVKKHHTLKNKNRPL